MYTNKSSHQCIVIMTHEPIGPIEAQSPTTHEQIELQDIEETHGHTIDHNQPKPKR